MRKIRFMFDLRFFLAILYIVPCLLVAQLPDMIPYKKGNLWGYADSTGRIILEPQWLGATLFDSNGLAQVGIEYEYRYKYKKVNKLRKQMDTEICSYGQIINKKGEPIIPHQKIADLMLKYNEYGFNCNMELYVKDSGITLIFNEADIMQFDFHGRLLFVKCGDEESNIYKLKSYAYVFNRQAIRVKDGIRFTDRYQNPKSRVYQRLFEDDWLFGNYYLFKIEGMDGKDSIIINPDGPAALVYYKKYWMFVDTSDLVLYKWKDKEEWPHIANYTHPKDSLRFSDLPQMGFKPCPPPFHQCIYPYDKFDTTKAVFAAWSAQGVLPTLYDGEGQFVHDLKLPYMLVKSDSFYSYIDTFGNLLTPFKYKKLTHFRSYYSVAFDTAWHWIDIHGKLLSHNQYKTLQRSGYSNPYFIAYDTAWHWIDEYGNILYDEYFRKGYQIVPFTWMSLFYDPKRNLYIDKYGREYVE